MKPKPMLFHKILGAQHSRAREVIGLIGTRRGAGVTYTGLMLAFYMGEELGKKTAFLECNNHHDLDLIRAAYEWSSEETFSFSFRRITCYTEVTVNRISKIYGEDYDCLILDFGDDLSANRDEFLRCTTKIIIGQSSEWDIQKLARFFQSAASYRGSDTWLCFIPQLDDKSVVKISKELNRKVLAVPYSKEPTLPSRVTNRFFGRIFPA